MTAVEAVVWGGGHLPRSAAPPPMSGCPQAFSHLPHLTGRFVAQGWALGRPLLSPGLSPDGPGCWGAAGTLGSLSAPSRGLSQDPWGRNSAELGPIELRCHPLCCWGLWCSATTNPTLIYSRKSCKCPKAAAARHAQVHRQDWAGPAWSLSPRPSGSSGSLC